MTLKTSMGGLLDRMFMTLCTRLITQVKPCLAAEAYHKDLRPRDGHPITGIENKGLRAVAEVPSQFHEPANRGLIRPTGPVHEVLHCLYDKTSGLSRRQVFLERAEHHGALRVALRRGSVAILALLPLPREGLARQPADGHRGR